MNDCTYVCAYIYIRICTYIRMRMHTYVCIGLYACINVHNFM